MPAVGQLALGESSLTASHSYHHFSSARICTGISILALLVVIRLVANVVLRSSSSNERGRHPERFGQACNDLRNLVNPQQFQHLFSHDGVRTMEERSREISNNTKIAKDESRANSSAHGSSAAEDLGRAKGITNVRSSEKAAFKGNVFGSDKPLDVSSAEFIMATPSPPPLPSPGAFCSVFPHDGHSRGLTGAVPELDPSFFQQPNPDYMTSTETATTTATQSTQPSRSSPTPRRRSYTKILPVGVPPSAAVVTSDGTGVAFSPTSYPPSSPTLPGPPPIHGEILEDGTFRKIEMHGEIISLLDDNGVGWKRHTRVYGGGVCLACAAASDEGHHGGFYGENVLPEEKRY